MFEDPSLTSYLSPEELERTTLLFRLRMSKQALRRNIARTAGLVTAGAVLVLIGLTWLKEETAPASEAVALIVVGVLGAGISTVVVLVRWFMCRKMAQELAALPPLEHPEALAAVEEALGHFETRLKEDSSLAVAARFSRPTLFNRIILAATTLFRR